MVPGQDHSLMAARLESSGHVFELMNLGRRISKEKYVHRTVLTVCNSPFLERILSSASYAEHLPSIKNPSPLKGEDYGEGEISSQSHPYSFRDAFRIRQNLVIPEPQHSKTIF